MNKVLKEHIEKALSFFTSDEFYDEVVLAKKEYFAIAGEVLEEDDDYENRMSSFNLWYLLQRSGEDKNTLMLKYFDEKNIDQSIIDTFLNVNHSLFEYLGTSFTKKHVLKDILHDRKIYLDKEYHMPSIVKNDIFLGRVVEFEGDSYLLDGIMIVPTDVRSTLAKESKKVRKLQDAKRDFQFLMQIEAFNTKWKRYGHIDAKRIFQFQ